MSPIWKDDIVGRLAAAVEAHVEPGARAGRQGIDERSLAGIPVAQIHDDVGGMIGHGYFPEPVRSWQGRFDMHFRDSP